MADAASLGRTFLGLALCGVAGCAGAFAAVCGKLAGEPGISRAAQVALYVALALCNALMLMLYSRSLRHNSSLAATAATLAANISATGLLARLVFGEPTSLQWWAGAVSILCGSFLVNRAQRRQQAAVAVTAAGGDAGLAAQLGLGSQQLEQQQLDHQQQQQQEASSHPLDVPAEEYSYIVRLCYDGTDYAGWQLQPAPVGQGRRRAKPTVQLRLEGALTKLAGEPREALKVQAAGRTDAGVHARGQVAQWRCRQPRDPGAALRALNAMLPPDIRALAVERVPLDFNVRYALRKTYSYDIHLGAVADPFTCRFRHHPRHPGRLRLDAVADALPLLVGTHNFSAFANWSQEGARKDPVKTILRYQLLPIDNGVRLEVEGTGFLYKQVRHMTGALLAVGHGYLGPDAITAALEAGPAARGSGAERHAARGWQVAEACGLCLQEVVYAPASPLPNP